MKTLLFLAAALAAGACKREPVQPPNGNFMPAPLVFALLDKQGNNLLASTTTPIQVYYVDANGQRTYAGDECAGGGCTMVSPFYVSGVRSLKYPFVYQSLGMSNASAGGTKTFYLEFGGKTDTLFYDVQRDRPNDPLMQYDTKSVIFNGRVVSIDQTQLPCYSFQRVR